jgi:TrpR family transcriptional regulator, trp operon repressor
MKKRSADEGWQGFLQLCSSVKTPEELERFFDLFLSIEEKEGLAARFLIVKAFMKGELTQREMAKTYKVSIAQITRGSNALKIIEPKLRKFLESQLKKE